MGKDPQRTYYLSQVFKGVDRYAWQANPGEPRICKGTEAWEAQSPTDYQKAQKLLDYKVSNDIWPKRAQNKWLGHRLERRKGLYAMQSNFLKSPMTMLMNKKSLDPLKYFTGTILKYCWWIFFLRRRSWTYILLSLWWVEPEAYGRVIPVFNVSVSYSKRTLSTGNLQCHPCISKTVMSSLVLPLRWRKSAVSWGWKMGNRECEM